MKKWYLLLILMFTAVCHGQVVTNFTQGKGKVDVALPIGTLRISSLTDNSIRIRVFKDTTDLPELVFVNNVLAPDFKINDSPLKLEIKGQKIIVIVDKQSGKLSFADKTGKIFLSETAGSRKLVPGTVMDVPCYTAEQSFESPADESIFGLGQFQDGHYNLRSVTRRLTQVNSQIAIPFIYSSKGYGLLWHQYGLTDFNPADNFIKLEKQQQPTPAGNQAADVTTTAGTRRVAQSQSIYTGTFSVPVDGEYSIFMELGDMGNRHYVLIDGKPCLDQSNMWLPPTASALVKLTKGEHQVQLNCKANNTPELSWKLLNNTTVFRSPNAKMLDYVVFAGSADDVIGSYRNLSGSVPMFPQWAYGFWQCRERYTSGTHLVETVKEFRKRNLPMDVIVQDWQYWGKYGWGVPKFDETNYPNPEGFIKELHDLNAHFSVSVWENLSKDSEIGKGYVAKNLFIPNSVWVDVLNPLGRETHWNALNENLFSKGVDSWWMDATEPENDGLKGKMTYMGPGDLYRLTYPLFVSQAVYEGQRKTSPDKRVCILTRSAFLGQQKYGVINWSGDIGGNWDTYKRQIVAGLNYTITGLPYWTTDIGGFFRSGRTQYTDEKYQELLTRWYQWGTFNPIFRIHGYQTETEPWKYGQVVEDNMRKMLNLRYRLLPYIYSEAWQVTKNNSTMMRPMVMDFIADQDAIKQSYQYMFGNAFLVSPITEPDVKAWSVYLPKATSWYDFWTGKRFEGGQSVKADAPLDKIPLFIKAGSIIPMGKIIQYSGEKPADLIELRIYRGANGEFTLYEDEGDNYNYEKGAYSTITFSWNDSKKVLTINDRKGSFKGMLNDRKFNIILVDENKGNGTDIAAKSDKEVAFSGKKIIVKL
jgi:alpha-D-xyloside xylohydrolase